MNNSNSADKTDIELVITPPFFTKMPHIGVAYLASFLNSNGFKANVRDLSLELFNKSGDEIKSFWRVDCVNSYFETEIAERIFLCCKKEIEEYVNEICASPARVIGFSVNLISIYLANKMAAMIKQKNKDKLVVFGGSGTYFEHPRDALKPSFADLYIIGEGEYALLNLLKSYLKKNKIPVMPGILLAKDSGQVKAVPAKQSMTLSKYNFPTYAGFILDKYNQGSDYKPLPLLSSRGCICRCSYCIDNIMWPKFRSRPAEHIMKEIRFHAEYNNTKAFEFNDLTCNGNLQELLRLCGLIIDSGLHFDWVSYAIIRKEMQRDLFIKMKKSGCNTIIYGIESGSKAILGKMGKNFTPEEASQVIRFTHEAGIRTNINIIVGFPGETDDDFNQTIRFVEENKDNIDEITNVSACTLFPDALLAKDKIRYGVNWTPETDPMLFTDVNGLGREARNLRVAKFLDIINQFGLCRSIVNKPILRPDLRESH